MKMKHGTVDPNFANQTCSNIQAEMEKLQQVPNFLTILLAKIFYFLFILVYAGRDRVVNLQKLGKYINKYFF